MSNDLLIKIGGSSKQFQDELEKVRAKTEDLEGQLSTMAKISGAAFAAFTAEIGLSVAAFAESQKASRQLETSLQNQGIFSKQLEQSYKDQAAALQDLTGVDDDAIVSSQALLQSYSGQMPITEDLTKAILDLSAGKEMDLQSTTELIGKGIEGHTMALKKLGIEIDEHLTKEERTAQIVEKVTQKFGGQAEAANKGLGGIKGLKSAFGDLQEEIGARFEPIISSAIAKITAFINEVKNNAPLLDMGAKILGIGLAVAAFGTALGTAGVALIAATSLMAAFGVTTAVATGGLTILAAAVVAAGVAFGSNLSTNLLSPMQVLQGQIDETRKRVETLRKAGEAGWGFFSDKEYEKAKAQLEDLEEKSRKMNSAASSIAGGAGQDPEKKAAADKAAAAKAAQEQREIEAAKAQAEVLKLTAENASQATIDLKKQEAETLKAIADENNVAIRDQLIEHLALIKELEVENDELNTGYRAEQFELMMATNEEYQSLSDAQKDRFRQQNQALLLQDINNEALTKELAAKKSAQEQIKNHNEYLENQRKYGAAYASINEFMHSEVYKGSKSAFGELAVLQTSSNSTLKGIGKAAAIANIVIKTAESAMNIFAGFSTIPFVGPALGAVGAAAAVAFGVEQVSKVQGAAEGGLAMGGIPGKDSIPFMLQDQELVAPSKNFEEVIGSVRASREAQKFMPDGQGNGGSGGFAHLVVEFVGDLAELVEGKIAERQNLGISLIPRGAVA